MYLKIYYDFKMSEQKKPTYFIFNYYKNATKVFSGQISIKSFNVKYKLNELKKILNHIFKFVIYYIYNILQKTKVLKIFSKI